MKAGSKRSATVKALTSLDCGVITRDVYVEILGQGRAQQAERDAVAEAAQPEILCIFYAFMILRKKYYKQII